VSPLSAPGEGGRWIGAPRRRVEDRPLLTGRGRFTDDLRRPGALRVVFVRSPHAHADIRRLDIGAAAAAPGVVRVVTAADVRHLGAFAVNPFFADMKVAPPPLLADGVVRAVGEPVAAVVAVSAALARDAADRVTVDYALRPPVVDVEAALAPGAPVIHPGLGTNRAFAGTWRTGDMAAARAAAARVVRLRVDQARLAAVPLEPRTVLAEWEPAAGELTVWTSTQAPFRARAELARILGLGEERVRVIAPDVGGGFGAKGATYREEVLVAWLALTLARPVGWTSTRAEDLLTTQQGRGARAEGALAVTADGRITGLEARIVVPLGAHAMVNAPGPARNHARTLPGAYVVPAVEIEVTGAYTTTPPTGPYRGAGRPEGIFLIERLMDEAARVLGLDPVEIRRRNLIPAGAFPYRTATGQVYDSGDYAAALDRALALADYARRRAEQARRRAAGEVTGLGLACYVEPAALGWESACVRVERTGAVTVITGASAHGQGHETVWAQVVADVLGVAPEVVRVLHGDTRGAPQGVGTFGSRSTALGGSAAYRAAERVRERARRLAAHLLEAAVDDVVAVDGGFQVAGMPTRRVGWAAVAELAYRGSGVPAGVEPGLEATVFFQAEGETWSFGTCLAAVDIDPDTGRVRLTGCVWVDDAGRVINPLLAEGQLHGGYAQGAGQALLEGLAYDGEGQLLTASLMDYALPRADDFPEPVLGATVTLSPRNPLGAKGLGEAGCIAVPAAVVNAVVDALAPFGVAHLDMPITPEKVWRVIRLGRR
jgi:carbon-monoxide dehydrogenase large subunit